MRNTKLFSKVIFFAGILCGTALSIHAQSSGMASQQTTDKPLTIKQSLELAGQNMLGMLDADRNYLPNWRITVRLDSYQANMAYWWPAHNIGRWVDASLRLNKSLGFEIPRAIEKAMIQNVKAFFDNPDKIMVNPNLEPVGCDVAEETYVWDLHSLREGLLALNGLIEHRDIAWARDVGRQMIRSLNSKLKDDGSWDMAAFEAGKKRGLQVIHNADACDTHGRLIEALVWFYELTGDKEAKEFADRLAKWHFDNTTQANGKINPASKADHTHSYLGTLRGLYLYGRLTNQEDYIKRVVNAYRTNVPNIVKPSGYTSHNMAVESFGETTSPGDVAQLALWMYLDGYADFLDDAERLVRSHILPSQILSTPKLTPYIIPQTNPNSNMYHNLDERIIGAYGGCTVYPNAGKVSVHDVTAADVHSLVDIYNHIVVGDQDVMNVLFHFDYDDERIRIATQENLDTRTLTVTLKQEHALSIRVPGWVPLQSIEVTSSNPRFEPLINKSSVQFDTLPRGTEITMKYDLPKKITTETNFGKEYTVYWRGDNIVGMSPNYEFYPFHPNIPTDW